MMEKIYGNRFFLDTVRGMFSSGRIAHSFLIYGEKGLGKKTAADYLAAAILCEKQNGIPCGECRSCRNAAGKVHPDIIYPEHSGKLSTYTVETCRRVCADSYIAPNNGNAKVYIFSDAGTRLIGMVSVDNLRYWIDKETGIALSGKIVNNGNGKIYMLLPNGGNASGLASYWGTESYANMATGIAIISGTTTVNSLQYYFDENGIILKKSSKKIEINPTEKNKKSKKIP